MLVDNGGVHCQGHQVLILDVTCPLALVPALLSMEAITEYKVLELRHAVVEEDSSAVMKRDFWDGCARVYDMTCNDDEEAEEAYFPACAGGADDAAGPTSSDGEEGCSALQLDAAQGSPATADAALEEHEKLCAGLRSVRAVATETLANLSGYTASGCGLAEACGVAANVPFCGGDFQEAGR